jgi:hypothetical protein
VGDIGNLWLEAEARAECEGKRADGIVSAVDRFNAAWEAWLHGRR